MNKKNENNSAYKKLALTDEQKSVLKELQDTVQKAIENGLYLVEVPGRGCFAYNAKNVDCFDAPENAAYGNGKDEIDVTLLHPAFRFGLMNYDLVSDAKCLVAFD